MSAKHEKESLTPEETTFSEIIGDLIEEWGFNRNLGRVWSLLYMRGTALSPISVQNALSMSVGNLNMSLNELQRWGVVRRVRIAGVRSFFYEAEPHIWKSVANVLQSREMRLLANAEVGLKHLQDSFKKDKKSKDEIQRITHVYDAVATASLLARHLIEMDPKNLARVSKLIGHLKSF